LPKFDKKKSEYSKSFLSAGSKNLFKLYTWLIYVPVFKGTVLVEEINFEQFSEIPENSLCTSGNVRVGGPYIFWYFQEMFSVYTRWSTWFGNIFGRVVPVNP
jgi:hypothetical protein